MSYGVEAYGTGVYGVNVLARKFLIDKLNKVNQMGYKRNTAIAGYKFHMRNSSDGSDVNTGIPVGYYTLDNGNQAAIADVTPISKGNGQWAFDISAAETNGKTVGLVFVLTGALTVNDSLVTDTKIVSELQDFPVNNLFQWDTSVTATDPGAGKVKGDNLVLANITNLYISQISVNGSNETISITNLEIGDTVSFQINGDGLNFIDFIVSAAITDNSTWMVIPVTFVETSGVIALNDILTLSLAYTGAIKRLDDAAAINTELRLSELDAVNLPAGTSNIQSRIPIGLVGGRMDSNISAINNNNQSAINLQESTESVVFGSCTGIPTSTVIPTNLTATSNSLKDRWIIFKSGPAINEAKEILGNTNGTLTIKALTSIPVATNRFVIV